MVFSEEQYSFLENIIFFEITDLQNNFINCSSLLKKFLMQIKYSIEFDKFIMCQIEEEQGSHLFDEHIKNFLNKKQIENFSNQETIDKKCFDKIIDLRFLSIKTFLKKDIDEKIFLKKLLDCAIYLDLYEFLIRKFDLIYNPDLIIKIADKFNKKFNFEYFAPWILLDNKNYFEPNYKNKFSEKFLNKIVNFAEEKMQSIQKDYIKLLKINKINFDTKLHINIRNTMRNFIKNKIDLFFFLDESHIDDIQNYINYFYMSEIADYYKNKVLN